MSNSRRKARARVQQQHLTQAARRRRARRLRARSGVAMVASAVALSGASAVGSAGAAPAAAAPDVFERLTDDLASVRNLVESGGLLFFAADDGINGQELWTSDGTRAGTRLLKDINPGPDTSYVLNPTVVGDTLFFNATDGSTAVNCGGATAPPLAPPW